MIPEIDGLRFLAILLVFLHHVHSFFEFSSTAVFTDTEQYEGLRRWLIESRKGVELFFVISGFILALPFARAYLSGTKSPSLGRYFKRRLTRLEPPYIAALLMMLVMFMILTEMDFPFAFRSFLTSVFYSHNIVYEKPSFLLSVAWSLELEVHFYLIAPLLFLLLKLPETSRRIALTAMIILLPWVQASYQTPVYYLFHYVQYFLAGILLADLYLKRPAVNSESWVVTVAGGLLFAGVIGFPHVRTHFIAEQEEVYYAMAFPVLILVFYYVVLTNPFWKAVFSIRWVSLIGGMCYSIYLLHQPILTAVMKVLLRYQFSESYAVEMLIKTLLCVPPVLIGSAVFFLLIEKPCMDPAWPSKLWRRLRGRKAQ